VSCKKDEVKVNEFVGVWSWECLKNDSNDWTQNPTDFVFSITCDSIKGNWNRTYQRTEAEFIMEGDTVSYSINGCYMYWYFKDSQNSAAKFKKVE